MLFWIPLQAYWHFRMVPMVFHGTRGSFLTTSCWSGRRARRWCRGPGAQPALHVASLYDQHNNNLMITMLLLSKWLTKTPLLLQRQTSSMELIQDLHIELSLMLALQQTLRNGSQGFVSLCLSAGLPLMPLGLKNISEKNWLLLARLLLLHQCTIPP